MEAASGQRDKSRDRGAQEATWDVKRDPRALPMGDMIASSLVAPIARFGEFFACAWLWIVAGHGISLLCNFAASATQISALRFGGAVAIAACCIAFALRWCRLLLLGSRRNSRASGIHVQEFRFYGYSILMAAALNGPPQVARLFAGSVTSIQLAALGTSLFLLIYVTIWTISARLSLVLPAAATGISDFRLKHAWLITRGNATRLSLGYFALLVLTLVLAGILALGWIWAAQSGAVAMMFIDFLGTVFVFVQIGVAATFACLAFHWFVRRGVS